MLKQIFITTALVLTVMGQQISLRAVEKGDPSKIITAAIVANPSDQNLKVSDSSKNYQVSEIVVSNGNTISDMVIFYIQNRSSAAVSVTLFSNVAGGADQQYIVPAGQTAVANIPQGMYSISGSAIGALSYLFSLNCGPSVSGRVYLFDNVEVSSTGCAELVIANN